MTIHFLPISGPLLDKIQTYRTPTELRQFEICTQTDSLFVNLNYLAELSEYFHVIRTGSYTEQASQKVILDDVFTEELVLFLSYVCPDGYKFDRTINEQNINSLIYFSDRLMFPWVKEDVKEYLRRAEFQSTPFDTETLIQLCYLLHSQSSHGGEEEEEIDAVFRKIALLKDHDLVKDLVDSIPDVDSRNYAMKKIMFFRPYSRPPRPQIFFNWDDTYSHLYDD